MITKVALNNVLPLQAARRDAYSANLKSFRVSGHQELNLDGIIYILYAVPPYSAGSGIIAFTEGGKNIRSFFAAFAYFRRAEKVPK